MFPGSPRLLQEEDWSGVVGKRDSGHPGVVNFRQHSHREVLPGEDLGVRRETKEVEKRRLHTRGAGCPNRGRPPPRVTIPDFDPLGEVSIARLQEGSTSLGAEPQSCHLLPVRHYHLEPQSPHLQNGNNTSLTRELEEFSKRKLLVRHSLPTYCEDVFYERGPRREEFQNLT